MPVVCREHDLDRLTRDGQDIARWNDDRTCDRGRRNLETRGPDAGEGAKRRADARSASHRAGGAVDRRMVEIAVIIAAAERKPHRRRAHAAREPIGHHSVRGATRPDAIVMVVRRPGKAGDLYRSEEHTSELQSLTNI